MNKRHMKPVTIFVLATGVFVLGPCAFAQGDASKAIEFQAQDAAKQMARRADARVQRNNVVYQSEIGQTKAEARSSADQCSVFDGWSERQFILDQAKAKESYLKQMEQKSEDADIQSMKQRTEAINESAKNLQMLVDEKPSDPGVHVDPNGTNLYVRNYK